MVEPEGGIVADGAQRLGIKLFRLGELTLVLQAERLVEKKRYRHAEFTKAGPGGHAGRRPRPHDKAAGER